MKTEPLKKGNTLQFQCTSYQQELSTINWESYQRINRHTPDFIRVIPKYHSQIIVQKTFRPSLNQMLYGFISLLSKVNSPSNDDILSLITTSTPFKITKLSVINNSVYSNPDECNSSQWYCVCRVDEQCLKEVLRDTSYLLIDTLDTQKINDLYEMEDVFDEELFTFLFSSILIDV
ncbi:Nudix hydrolase domain-containing protein [Entamoeba marina]